MDAQYIANNVSTALKEGLAAMTVSHPEDKVDFLGRYLLSYVQRKKKSQMTEDELRDILSHEESYNKEVEETKESERRRIALITHQATEAITIEQEKFITMNAGVTSRLSEAILKIPELEEAALTYVPPPPVVEGGEGEGGELGEGEVPPAEVPPVVEEVPAVVPEGEPVPEEPQFDENGNEIIKPPPPIPEKQYNNMLIVQRVWNNLFMPGEPGYESLMSLSQWTPAPISGDASLAFKTTIDGQIIVLLMTLCVVLGINTDGFKDPSGNPVWSLIRMKLLPQLSQKLTTYDATEKKTVSPEQSTAAIRANIVTLGLDQYDSFVPYIPIAPLLAQWMDKALSTRELCMKFHLEKAEPEVLETVEAVVVAEEGGEEE